MSDEETTPEITPEAIDPTEVQIPEEVAKRLSPDMLIDASRVLMMVGTEKEARPMSMPQVFQEIFAILGDIDKRLQALENPGTRPSGLIVPN
jgi:hypothetical protein